MLLFPIRKNIRGNALIFALLAFSSIFIFSNCATIPDKKDMRTNETAYADKLFGIITQINFKRPDTLSAHPSISFYNNGRKVTAQGDLYLISNPQTIHLKLSDPILKFLIADVLMTDGSLKMFVPTENTVYITSPGIKGILKPGINPAFVSSVALGCIPVISNPSEISSFSDEKKRDILELKNNMFIQTILFENDIPVHTIIRNITSSEKTEIFFSEPLIKDNFILYAKIKAYSEPDGSFFEVSCKNYRLNDKIEKKNLNITIPANVKTVIK
jgi:hypothetical protein